MTTPSYPQLDLNAIRAAIGTVRALDLVNLSIDEIKVALAPVIEGYQVNAPILDAGMPIWRSLVVSKPANIRDISYPPAHLAPIGRANRRGSPVLYCSASREGAFFEVAPEVGDTVVLAQWRTTAPLVVNHVGYTQNAFAELGSHRTHWSWANRSATEPGQQAQGEIDTFLANLFTRRINPDEPYLYKLSIAIAEMLAAQDLFNGLMYPTVALSANSDNLAIKTAFADTSLVFVRAELVRVNTARNSRYEFTPLDVAKSVDGDGTIIWRGRPDQLVITQDRPLTLTAENGRWVARDSDGKIVEPE